MKFFTRTRTVTRDRMQRPPVAAIDTSRRHYDDNGTTTYGVEKLSFFNVKMRFWVLVGVAAVVCVAVSGVESVGASVISDLKYLEHLNDLDVRNVEPELDDIHQQWPFVSIARPTEEDGEKEEEQQEDGEEEDAPGQKYVDPESLLQAAVLTRLEMGNNKHSQNFREMLFDRMDEGLRHAKDNSERADHLSQYRRYKPFEQDLLEEARMYPDRNEEDDGRFHNDDAAYLNTDTYFADEDEVVKEPHRLPFPRPFFPRIAPVETPSFGDAFRDTLEEDQFPEESQKEVTMESHKPLHHHHQVLFPRIAPVDFHKNYDLDDIGFGNNKQHQHAEYQFKEGEEFPETVKFEEVPVVEDLTEFGVRPNDPRFYRDAEDTEEKTAAPNVEEEPVHPYILNSAYVSKSKLLNSKSDFHNPKESLPEREDLTNREVQVVPFKPDQGEDSAGVYIIAIVAGISAAATVGLIAVGIGWYKWANRTPRLQRLDGCISD